MDLYFYIASDDLEELAEPISATLSSWIGEENERKTLVNQLEENKLGVNISVDSKNQLKKPLKFLYTLAKEHKCDFVVGIFSGEASGDVVMEDVCYFGHEEGRPDMFEMANYLGL